MRAGRCNGCGDLVIGIFQGANRIEQRLSYEGREGVDEDD